MSGKNAWIAWNSLIASFLASLYDKNLISRTDLKDVSFL